MITTRDLYLITSAKTQKRPHSQVLGFRMQIYFGGKAIIQPKASKLIGIKIIVYCIRVSFLSLL